MRWLAGAREALRGMLFRRREDAELDEELRFHLEQETLRLMREEGHGAAEARRRAGIAFGGIEKHREEVRAARGLAWVSGMSLDVRLGARMLVRSWGLTLAGGLGIAMAIALGSIFHAATRVVHTPLPLDRGAEIVALESWDATIMNQERRILHDFAWWRQELKSVVELSAYRTVGRNLIGGEGPPEALAVAEMSASGFRVARVPALLGRTLLDEDERSDAPPVVVIGYDVWRTRFRADPAILGRDVRLGSVVHRVVGVMPEGFAFPLNHRFWVPLQADVANVEPGEGPSIHVFGRLAPGSSLATAAAELATVGQRAAAAYPDTHRHLHPRVVPYPAQLFDDMEPWAIPLTHMILLLLLAVVCGNVAILIYARTVTRAGEIAVRSALGASRRRIVGQLFVEALVLSTLAAAAGLVVAGATLGQINALLDRWEGPGGVGLPFWIEFRLSASTVLYALALAGMSAAVLGIVPALKTASGRLQPTLRQLAGGTGLQLGRTWNVLIVAQVALTVALLPLAVSAGWKTLLHASADPGFAAHEYVGGRLVLDREDGHAGHVTSDPDALRARFAGLQAELALRLKAEPRVAAITFADELPGLEPTVRVEIEDVGSDPSPGEAALLRARYGRVDTDFMDAFELPILSGRGFHSGDVGAAATAVIVSRSLAEQVGSGSAVGRRIRYVEGYRSGGVVRTPLGIELGRWYEIIGVVPDFPNAIDPDEVTARVYHSLAAVQPQSVNLIVRSTARADLLIAELQHMTAALDPTLQLRDVRSLDSVLRELQGGARLAAAVLAFIMCSVLLLSAAGIYALMSFTVARRRREIGIRAALGAGPRRILSGIFSRALSQLAAGIGVGVVIAGLLDLAVGGQALDGRAAVLLPLVATLMITVGLLAALEPAYRGLRIQPTEALREE